MAELLMYWPVLGVLTAALGLIPTGVRADNTDADPASLTEAVTWLDAEAHRIIRASRREMNDGAAAFPPQVGIGYEAFWLRDYEYTLEGSIDAYSDKELLDACRLFLRSLRGDGAGVDCVKFDGTPIYMPGYGSMGQNPVADGSQFTVAVVWHTHQKTRSAALLQESLGPLVKTMECVPRNPKNGLVHIVHADPRDRCGYGFTDTIYKEGDVLFSSLLYVQACRQLSGLLQAGGRDAEAQHWAEEGQACAASVRTVFWDAHIGLFRAATERCREHDIWGSAFAVYLGVADAGQSAAVANYFKDHYKAIVQHGQIRHLPGGVYWEKGCRQDAYQNGAYWATPTGWFVYTLDLVDPSLADRTVIDLVRHCRRYGACEWIFGDTRKLPNYLASASLPLAGIRAMLERRQGREGRRITETTALTFNLPRVGTLSQQIWDSSIVLGVERIQCSRTPDSTCGDHDIGIYQIHRLGPFSLFGLLSQFS